MSALLSKIRLHCKILLTPNFLNKWVNVDKQSTSNTFADIWLLSSPSMTLSNDCCLDFDTVLEMCVISAPFLVILSVDHEKQEKICPLLLFLMMLAFQKKKKKVTWLPFKHTSFKLKSNYMKHHNIRYKQHEMKKLKRLLMRPILTHLDSPLYWLVCGFFAISERVFIVWLDVS